MTDQNIKILDDIEHILCRPAMYVGNIKPEIQEFWVVDEHDKLKKEKVEYIPALFKLFSEILDNAIDEHVRGFGKRIDVVVDEKEGTYTIKDYARGIPLEKHKEAKIPTPQVVFTKLRAGSNFDDSIDGGRQTIGMNGVGASLTTVFSEKLEIEVCRKGRQYNQSFEKNMSVINKPIRKKLTKKETGTKVKFKPDRKLFSSLIPIGLIKKRCLDIAVAFPNIEIHFSDTKNEIIYKVNTFEDFVKRFSTEYTIIEDKKINLKLAICKNNISETFEHYSNINGSDTFRGGTHVDYFKELFVQNIRERIDKENKIETTYFDVSKNLFLVVFQMWSNPQFDSQTKDKFVIDKKDLDKYYDKLFTQKKLTHIINSLPNLKESIVNLVNLKNNKKEMAEIRKLNKKIGKKKIPKLIEASNRNRMKCTLYITEGDSAISNLATVRDSKFMAGLPLRGKVLNVNEMNPKKIIENKEIQSLINSIGLMMGEKATSKNLNYGKIVIATDQDMDGYCIRCLLINFFYSFWPELFDQGRIFILETPLYEVIGKNKDIKYFYNKHEFENFMKGKKSSSYEISYFKGLGSCGKEAWNYMINEKPNLVRIENEKNAEEKLLLAFSGDSDERKEWLK